MNRYMVFSYTTYDNPSPFECLAGDFNDLDDAIKCAINERNECQEEPDCGQFAVIFDRISGGFINADVQEGV